MTSTTLTTDILTGDDLLRALDADIKAAEEAERIDHIRGLERALEADIEAIKDSDADSAEMILRSDFEELDYLRFLIAQLDETFVATHVRDAHGLAQPELAPEVPRYLAR